MKEIELCIGSSCHVRGSFDVVEAFKKIIAERGLEDEVHLKGSFCMNACSDKVSVRHNGVVYKVKPDGVEALFDQIMEAD